MKGNKLDLVVSFDTTGSMYPVLGQVRSKVEEFIGDIFSSYDDLRLAVIAHGDYCDRDNPYTIRIMDFTTDKNALAEFVKKTDKTYGGDADECYELVLNSLTTHLHWRDDATKIAIIIGDAAPHSPNYSENKDRLDWKEETEKIYKEGIKIFAVHALAAYRRGSKPFYKKIADETSGVYLTLDQFSDIIEIINATVYQQAGEEKLNEYISIIRDRGDLSKSLDNNFRRLKGEIVEDDYSYAIDYSHETTHRSSVRRKSGAVKEMEDLVPVLPGRFQTLTVDKDTPIKEFVEKYGAGGVFKTGRGFYELTKAETVQQYKEIIMQNRETGEMFTGMQVREKLGLSPQTESGGVNEKLHKSDAREFRIFVQSTSVNRKLIGGTTFLYDMGDLTDTGTIMADEPESHKEKPEVTEVEPEATKVEIESSEKKSKEPSKVKSDTKKSKVSKAKVSEKAPEEPKVTVTTKKKSLITTTTKASKELKKTAVTGVNNESLERATAQLDKVRDALERLTKSRNKKNTEFARNNITKMIKYLTDVNNELD
jgi:hypothetical protein